MTDATHPAPVEPAWSLPLGGCDCYLLALDAWMASRGQGRQRVVTFLELEGAFSTGQLRNALGAFAAAYPVVFAKIVRNPPCGIPEWRPSAPGIVECMEHPPGTPAGDIARKRMEEGCGGHLAFDVLPRPEGATVLMTWSHLLWDARGAELTLAEISRFAEAPGRAGMPRERWGFPAAARRGFLEKLRAVRPFVTRHSELRKELVVALGGSEPAPGQPRFELLRFDADQTAQIRRRAAEVTGGIFTLPYFLAVTMRAHAAVLRRRGVAEGALECSVSAQLRKRGHAGALFQNQLSQIFFSLGVGETGDLEGTARALHGQFERANREGIIPAFLIMVDWMRRLPGFLYRRFLEREASGRIASFYYGHTGTFLPGLDRFCGAGIADGWHVPTVFQPPGTGLFFSERAGRLTASLCWRSGVLSEAEVAVMRDQIHSDLLGRH